MNLKGTKTEENLKEAFAGESQAQRKYSYYASKAKKEGLNQIAELFETTAHNENAHAKIWFKLLHGGVPTTEKNLLDCIAGEHYETAVMYKEFAKTAKEEGLEKIAYLFEEIGKIEAEHEARFKVLLENIKNEQVFKKNEEQVWECGNCGYFHKGTSAPEKCPVCDHPKAYFRIHPTNF